MNLTPRPQHLSKAAIETIAVRHASAECRTLPAATVAPMVDRRYKTPRLRPTSVPIITDLARGNADRVHSGPRILNEKQTRYYVRAYLAAFAAEAVER